MNVKLQVLHGANAGKDFKVPTPRCLVGRGPDCQLQAKSEAVSRHHCLLYVTPDGIAVRDLNSRNGTFVNGKRVNGDCELHDGDTLQIGPLAFAMHIDRSLAGGERPSSSPLPEAGERMNGDFHEADSAEDATIAEWLVEADEAARARRLKDPETRLLKAKATAELKFQRTLAERQGAGPAGEPAAPPPTKMAVGNEAGARGVRGLGKAPPRPEEPSEDSSEAAAHALKRFFERRP